MDCADEHFHLCVSSFYLILTLQQGDASPNLYPDLYTRFAPITVISGIYGMNVSEISGSNSNPNIWQFFVAVMVLNVVVMLALAILNWVHIATKHGRTAGAKEVLKFAVCLPPTLDFVLQ